MTQERKRIRSIVLFIGILLLAIGMRLIFHKTDSGSYAVITVDGTPYRSVSLSVDCEFVVKTDTGYNRISVQNGQIRVKEADCSNQVCVHTGGISHGGEVIACLPHGLTVTVQSSKGEVDTIAY